MRTAFQRIPTYFMVIIIVGVLGFATWGVTYALWVQPEDRGLRVRTAAFI